MRSLGQTRLDRIWQDRSQTAWTEYVRWRTAFVRTHYSAKHLAAWSEELEEAIPRVEAQVQNPPAAWTGARWDQAHEMLLRLRGQQQAVTQTLKERTQTVSFTAAQLAQCAGPSSGPGSKPSTCTGDTEPDPFANE